MKIPMPISAVLTQKSSQVASIRSDATVFEAITLMAEKNVSAEVIDLRSLVPLDLDTILRSVQKTGRCVVASQAIHIGSYTGEIASTIQEAVFDYLDAPVKRVGAKNGIAPQSHILEAAFLPGVSDLLAAANEIL